MNRRALMPPLRLVGSRPMTSRVVEVEPVADPWHPSVIGRVFVLLVKFPVLGGDGRFREVPDH